MATVTELVTKFMFVGNTAPLAQYNAQLGASIKLIASFAAAAATTGAAIALWATHVLEGVDALGDLSAETRVTVAEIQELGFAAQLSGSSSEALQASLRGLSSTAGLAANGMGRGAEIFKKLGINVRDANGQVKTSAQLLDEIRQRMNALNMSLDERRAFATRLGIDGSLVQYLSRTDAEMAKLIARAKELGTLTQEQAEAAGAYNDSLDVMRYAMTAIKQQIAVGLAPALTGLAETVTDLLADNKDWIVNGIRATTVFIGELLKMLMRLLPVLAVVGAAFVAAKLYLMGFAGIMAVVTSPIVLTTAAIVALILVVDDLIVAFKGGNSLIGDFFKNFLGIDLSKVIDQLKSVWEWYQKIVAVAYSKIGRALGFGGDKPAVAMSTAVTTGSGGNASSVSGSTDNRKIEQTVNIEVKSNDPVQAGRAAADGVQRQLKDANAQLSVGGL